MMDGLLSTTARAAIRPPMLAGPGDRTAKPPRTSSWQRPPPAAGKAESATSSAAATQPTIGIRFIEGRGSFGAIGSLHGVIHPADHHLFPGLIAPFDRLRRVGVGGIARGVIKMG